MKGNVYTVCFAAILGTVCALMLTGVAEFTEESRERNKTAEKNRNIFTALEIKFDEKASVKELAELFKKSIQEKSSIDKLADLYEETVKKYSLENERIDAFAKLTSGIADYDEIQKVFADTIKQDDTVDDFTKSLKDLDHPYPELTLYRNLDDQGEVIGVAIDFTGKGLWATIKGILALEPDMITIRGITFYEQEETPGLGGDIVTEGFRGGFVGKKIVDDQGNPGIVIKAGLKDAADNEIDGISGATMTIDKVAFMLNEVIGKLAISK